MTSASPDRTREHEVLDEQAALRRVAVLVARAAPPREVFAAVAEEAARLLGADHATLGRYDPGGAVSVIVSWSSDGAALPAGTQLSAAGRDLSARVFQARQAARLHEHASVGAPVTVAGRLWGVMIVASTREPLPVSAEARLAGFAELAATAIASAAARTELRSFAEEQAALRRVAMLVARAAPPEKVFTAVAEEVGQIIPDADFALVGRFNADRAVEAVGGWDRAGSRGLAGLWASLGEADVSSLLFDRNQPVRIDHLPGVSSEITGAAHEASARCCVGAPISVDGRPWGVMIVASMHDGVLLEGAEHRLAGFAELVATAIADAAARAELRGFAEEQAALRRVAVLVAQGSPPEEVLAAVTDEGGRLLGADFAVLSRYDADGLATVVGHWASTGPGRPLAIGLRVRPEGRNILAQIFETGHPVRIDDYDSASGALADVARDGESRASVGVPIWVEGRLWGVMSVGSRSEPLPAGTEARLAGFTELAATAIANAEAQAALAASRARIVAAADQTRRRIERDLHDGAQQRLVSLALQLRAAQQVASPEAGELAGRLEGAIREATGVLEELREIARGLHPAILTETGLRPALRALARRSAVPVDLDVRVPGRLPEQIEVSGYYVVAEALTNSVKHARASAVNVEVEVADDVLRVTVRDDGTGGADLALGAGLAGLKDRVEALGGRFRLDSPPGAGTAVHVEFPLAITNAGAVPLRTIMMR